MSDPLFPDVDPRPAGVAHQAALDAWLTQSITALLHRGVVTMARVADRMARVEEALAQLPAIEATKQRQTGKRPTAARVSTTDPDARVMKMADGGYRPAYNVQLATDVDSRAIVGVAVTKLGSDRSSLMPRLGQLQARTGRVPGAALVDGGCVTRETITDAWRPRTRSCGSRSRTTGFGHWISCRI